MADSHVTRVAVPLSFLIQVARFGELLKQLDEEADAEALTYLTATPGVRLATEQDGDLAATIHRDDDYWYVEIEYGEGTDG